MRNAGRRTNLFLVELVLNLFIFALCAAVCVGLLVHARGISRESTRLTDAVYLAQNAAETWRSGGTPGEAQGDYRVELSPGGSGTCDISVWLGDELIFTLEGVARP